MSDAPADATSRDVRETPQSWARLSGDVYWDTTRAPWWAWGLVFGLALFRFDLAAFALAFLVVFAIRVDAGGEDA